MMYVCCNVPRFIAADIPPEGKALLPFDAQSYLSMTMVLDLSQVITLQARSRSLHRRPCG